MESALRPRDIQARIRAGESPRGVAEAAQTTVDNIMVFAAPVLAERAHVAERAQRSVRRRSTEASTAGAGTLGDAVSRSHLRRATSPAPTTWSGTRGGARTAAGPWPAAPLPQARGHRAFATTCPATTWWPRTTTPACAGREAGRPRPGPSRPLPPRRAPPGADSAPRPRGELPLGDDAIELVSDAPERAAAPSAGLEDDATLDLTDSLPLEGFGLEPRTRRGARDDTARESGRDESGQVQPSQDTPATGQRRDADEQPAGEKAEEPAEEKVEEGSFGRPVKKSRVGHRCPAGTRSCSVAAPATESLVWS